MYEVIYSQQAAKDIKKLPKEIQARILAAIERIRIRPYPYVKKLVGCPYFRLRIDDYRIIIDIQENKLLIFVIELGHRSTIYQ